MPNQSVSACTLWLWLCRGALSLAWLAPVSALAVDPGYYVVTPYSTPGQWVAEARYWTVQVPGGPLVRWPEAGLRYGVNSRWTTGLLASWIGPQLSQQRLSTTTWHNTVLLTQGELPFDLALHAQVVRQQGGGNALVWGPVFQWDAGATQINFNALFNRDRAAHAGAHLQLQAQALVRLQRGVRVGVQGFGDMGQWNDWASPPSTRVGPAVRLGLGSSGLEWQSAYLWGRTNGRQGNMFSTQLVWPL